MTTLEPIPETAAAVADLETERLLLIADYHAGFEAAARIDQQIELRSRASDRRERLLDLVESTNVDRVVVLGDLTHTIGEPMGAERGEIELLVESLSVPLLVAKGNHDGILEELLATDDTLFGNVTVLPPSGDRIDELGVAHGHTWPGEDVLGASIVCIGHEHPSIQLTDEVGGWRVDRVWLRGELRYEPFLERGIVDRASDAELVVFPAFNELCGGTWVNVPDQDFLAPFLPAALPDGKAYLLDGTQLGSYRSV